MLLATLVLIAQPSLANSGSMDRSNSDGHGWATFRTDGQRLFLTVSAHDSSCNDRGFMTSVKVTTDGGPEFSKSASTTAGCGSGQSIDYVFSASTLEGKRSGIMTLSLCHKVIIGWSCGGVLESRYWNI